MAVIIGRLRCACRVFSRPMTTAVMRRWLVDWRAECFSLMMSSRRWHADPLIGALSFFLPFFLSFFFFVWIRVSVNVNIVAWSSAGLSATKKKRNLLASGLTWDRGRLYNSSWPRVKLRRWDWTMGRPRVARVEQTFDNMPSKVDVSSVSLCWLANSFHWPTDEQLR